MESWGGHIWGPPLWVFTFKDKWSHWVPASCEWAPSAHMGPLNAHQNNFSKPRDAFLRCLMWGQIGNHFNKIPPRLNCISQKTRPERGEAQGTATVEPLPAVFKAYLKREHLLCWQVYSRRMCNRNAQVTDSRLRERWGWHSSGRKDVDQSRRLSARVDLWIFKKYTVGEEVKPLSLVYFYMPSFWGWKDNNKLSSAKAILFQLYFTSAPPPHLPPLSATPSFHKHKTASRYRLNSPLHAPCNYTIGRKHLFLGSLNVWLLFISMRLPNRQGYFTIKNLTT